MARELDGSCALVDYLQGQGYSTYLFFAQFVVQWDYLRVVSTGDCLGRRAARPGPRKKHASACRLQLSKVPGDVSTILAF